MPKRTCSLPECDRIHKGHGLCDMHLGRLRRTGTTDSPIKSQEQRFWEKVDKRGPDECWPWTAALTSTGYGALRPEGRRVGPVVKAHRYSAQLAGMDIDGKHVLHSCDNPPCVNPAHLRPGTDADNMADLKERGRHVGNRKLTADAVRAIRRRLASGDLHRVIAEDFGVSRPTISVIAEGKAWREVAA